jgi:hypothetical protein
MSRQDGRTSDSQSTPHENAVFASYKWGGEGEEIVNQIEQALRTRGVKLIRDKRDLGYKGSIRKFMERMGRGACVIVVINDGYLRSKHCMFELMEIAEAEQFHDRVFPVVLGDAGIYEGVNIVEYVKYWEDKLAELAEAMKTVGQAHLQGIRDEIDLYDRIRDELPGLVTILSDMNTLTPEMHEEGDYAVLAKVITERLLSERLSERTENETPARGLGTAVSTQAASEQVAQMPDQTAHPAHGSQRSSASKDWWNAPVVLLPLLVAIVGAIATIISAIINIYPTLPPITRSTPVPLSPTPSCMSDVEHLVKFRILRNEQESITINPKEVFRIKPSSIIEVQVEITAANNVLLVTPQCTWTNTGTGTDGQFLQKAGCTVVYQSGHTRIGDALRLQVSQPSCPGLFTYAFLILPEEDPKEVP